MMANKALFPGLRRARRAAPHVGRAVSHSCALFIWALVAACGPEDAAGGDGIHGLGGSGRPGEARGPSPGSPWTNGSPAVDRRTSPEAAVVQELVRALSPPDLTWTSDRLDAHFHAGREVLARLREAGPDVGREALRSLLEDNPEEVTVRTGLLEVAAFASPLEARPFLERLIQEYGHRMSDRTEAVRLLAETSPASAQEILGPWLRQERVRLTIPDGEFLLAGWVIACKKTGTDPVEVLSTVAGNIFMQDAARHRAVEELGRHPGTLSRATLEAILVESTGNGYLRRKAAQALRASVPAESACSIFKVVAEREADQNMLLFLLNMLEEVCG